MIANRILFFTTVAVIGSACFIARAKAGSDDARTSVAFVAAGQSVLLDDFFTLGERQLGDDCLQVHSASVTKFPAYGSHYASIAVHSNHILEPGDFEIRIRLGLVKKNAHPAPLVLNVLIGGQYFDFEFDQGRLTFRGIMLDSVRYFTVNRRARQPIQLDGTAFSLSFVRRGSTVRVSVDQQLVHELELENTRGPIGLSVERTNLLRVSRAADVEAVLKLFDFRATGCLAKKSPAEIAWEQRVGASQRYLKRLGSAFAFVPDRPRLPNVLLIGDSISLYYTDPVRRLLAEKADVFRTPMGPGKAETLFSSLDAFLKEKQWDIIHFNSGLHDMVGKAGVQQDMHAYRANLEVIVNKLSQTGAQLIWASTTPIPKAAPGSDRSIDVKYNAVAQALMREYQIPIDDLYRVILPHHEKYWLRPNNIHFNAAGSAVLGEQVAKMIAATLENAERSVDRTASGQSPQVTLRAQGNESDVVRLPDGSLRLIITNRFLTESFAIFSRTSTDHGGSWSDLQVEFNVPRRAFGSKALVDQSGRLHVFFIMQRTEGRNPGVDRLLDVWHASKDVQKVGADWTEPQRIFAGYVGALLGVTQLQSGRMLLPFAYWVGGRPSAPPTGSNITTVLFSDDQGASWQASGAELTAPCDARYNGNNYGAIEPDVVQLSDGRVWMLMRTQTGFLYESFSADGVDWSPAAPSRFQSGNGPAAFLRLPDDRLVVLWNNCELPPRTDDGQGVYGGRDELQAAISADDGRTWRGFRTVYRDPNRDQTPPERGDRGTAYPDAEIAADGRIVVASGHGEPAGVVRFHPDWLTQTYQHDDFSDGLDGWAVFKHFGPARRWWRDRNVGPQLIDHPDQADHRGRRVLHLRRPDERPGDGAVWNFPLGRKGRLTLRLMTRKGFGGARIALCDRFFNPGDPQGETMALFRLALAADGQSAQGIPLRSGRWHDIGLHWDLNAEQCAVLVDGQRSQSLRQNWATLNGVCYLRLRSSARDVDTAGLLIESVTAEIDAPNAPARSAKQKRAAAEAYAKLKLQ